MLVFRVELIHERFENCIGEWKVKNNRFLLGAMGIVAVLLIVSIIYISFNNYDVYEDFTGLGNGITIAPDDTKLGFSYYYKGQESIYTADADGNNVKPLIQSEGNSYSAPKFSPDGKGILCLSVNEKGVQSIYYMPDMNKKVIKRLTVDYLHIWSANFSPDGNIIYFSGMPAEDLVLLAEENERGSDLYTIKTNGKDLKKLTKLAELPISDISVSNDGKTIYYSVFNEQQELRSYDIETEENKVLFKDKFAGNIYYPVHAPNESLLAYTAVSEPSKERDVFEYELYLYNKENALATKLTNYQKAIESPVFFNNQDRLLFLGQKNWPEEPAKYELITMNYNGGILEKLELDLPKGDRITSIRVLLDRIINGPVLFVLYVLLFGLWTLYMKDTSKSIYKPAKVSAVLIGISALGMLALSFFEPWIGIGLTMVLAGLVVATLIVFGFAYVLKRQS